MTQIQKDYRHVCSWDDSSLDFSDLCVRVVRVSVRVKKQEKSWEVEDGLERVRQQTCRPGELRRRTVMCERFKREGIGVCNRDK